jgi:outer membrane protein assembly factor BamB
MKRLGRAFFAGSVTMMAALLLQLPGAHTVGATAPGNDWTKYVHDNAGSGFTSENLITPTNAPLLALRQGWPVRSTVISTQPIVANGLVYWGSWDGFERATPVSGGSPVWATNLGQTNSPSCGTLGVMSTADIATVGTSPYLFVGGGGNNPAGGGAAQLYALNPSSGAVYWHTALGTSPSTVIWSSPAAYTFSGGTSVYVGVASFCDMPLVQGQLVQLDATTGSVQHVFDVVPSGCLGGGVWGSPTIDETDGSVYVASGNPAPSCAIGEPYAVTLLKLRASDLTLLGAWTVPAVEQIGGTTHNDSDFGSTPTLFTGTVRPGGALRNLIGVANKNGIYYVLDRSNVAQGPVARLRIAMPGESPEVGDGSISPSSWDGTQLYVAGGRTALGPLGSKSFQGSLNAFNPNNLSSPNPVWSDVFTDGPVLGAVTSSPGLAVVGEGPFTVMVNSGNGAILFRAPVKTIVSGKPAVFFGAPTIAHGVLYEGDSQGYLYAYSVGGQ